MLTLICWMMTTALAAPEDAAPVVGPEEPAVEELPLEDEWEAPPDKAKEPVLPDARRPLAAPAQPTPEAEAPLASDSGEASAAEDALPSASEAFAPLAEQPIASTEEATDAAPVETVEVGEPHIAAPVEDVTTEADDAGEPAPVVEPEPGASVEAAATAEAGAVEGPAVSEPPASRPFTPAPSAPVATTEPARAKAPLVHIAAPTPEQLAYRERRREERQERREDRAERRQQRTVFGPRPRSRFLGAWAGASLGAPGLSGPTTGGFEAGAILGGSLRLGVDLRGVSYGPDGPDVRLTSSGFLVGWTFETRSVVHPTVDAVFGAGLVRDGDGDVLGGVGLYGLRGGAELNLTRSVRVGASLGWRGISAHNDTVRRDLDGLEGLVAVRLGWF